MCIVELGGREAREAHQRKLAEMHARHRQATVNGWVETDRYKPSYRSYGESKRVWRYDPMAHGYRLMSAPYTGGSWSAAASVAGEYLFGDFM